MRSYKGEMRVGRHHRLSIVIALALTVAGVIGSTFVSAAERRIRGRAETTR